MGFQFFPGVKFHPLLLKNVFSSHLKLVTTWSHLHGQYPTKGMASMNHRSTDGSDAPAEVERITMEDHMLKQEVGCWVLQAVTFLGWWRALSDPFLRGLLVTSNVWGWKGHELNHLGVDIFLFCKGYEHENWHVFFEAKLSGWRYF